MGAGRRMLGLPSSFIWFYGCRPSGVTELFLVLSLASFPTQTKDNCLVIIDTENLIWANVAGYTASNPTQECLRSS